MIKDRSEDTLPQDSIPYIDTDIMNNNKLVLINHLKLIITLTTALTSIVTIQNRTQAVTFQFLPAEETSDTVINQFKAAGDFWSQYLHDDVTINVEIGFTTLTDNFIGAANPSMVRVKYADAINQFVTDQTSNDDQIAINHLSTNSDGGINRLINNTDSWFGTTHQDKSTKDLWLTSANAKALGIIKGDSESIDGSIVLNSSVNWDFNHTDGVAEDGFDLFTTAAHEIGHLLGFVSGVDMLDYYQLGMGKTDEDYNFVTAMDLFRHSEASYLANLEDETLGINDGITIDWRSGSSWLEELLGTEAKYFSIDGGKTKIANFSQGQSYDGYQTSHWEEGSNRGIMTPKLEMGESKEISNLDLQLLDVAGWDVERKADTDYGKSSLAYTQAGEDKLYGMSWGRTSQGSTAWSFYMQGNSTSSTVAQVPEPASTMGLISLGLLGLHSLRKRFQ